LNPPRYVSSVKVFFLAATGTDTACEFIDFSGGNSNHGEMISP
jgi:hypothetical protein